MFAQSRFLCFNNTVTALRLSKCLSVNTNFYASERQSFLTESKTLSKALYFRNKIARMTKTLKQRSWTSRASGIRSRRTISAKLGSDYNLRKFGLLCCAMASNVTVIYLFLLDRNHRRAEHPQLAVVTRETGYSFNGTTCFAYLLSGRGDKNSRWLRLLCILVSHVCECVEHSLFTCSQRD